ncbi:hypothetical protein IJ579_00150 [bacterium]|nr:hypothetical protein [bacterium]
MEKIIHYFFDNVDIWEKGDNSIFRLCYASWLKYCPDYKIKLWHCEMSEFQQMLKDSKFLRECYKRKMWAFVADYVRHYALYHYGGIYLDTDVQLVGNFDKYLDKPFFCSIEGDILNGENILESAVMGGEKGHIMFKTSLDFYNSDEVFKVDYFIDPILLSKHLKKLTGFNRISYNEGYDELAQKYYNPEVWTNKLDKIDLYKNQKIYENSQYGIFVYPCEYFCPSWNEFKMDAFSENTVAIHWNQASWWGEKMQKNIDEVESFRYSCLCKRFLYRKAKFIAKLLTFFVPIKGCRRRLREKIEGFLRGKC